MTTDSTNGQISNKALEYSSKDPLCDQILESHNPIPNAKGDENSYSCDTQDQMYNHQKGFLMNDLSPKSIIQKNQADVITTTSQCNTPPLSINYIASIHPSMENKFYGNEGNGSISFTEGVSESIIGAETYYGYIGTVQDAVLVVEACRHGRLGRIKKRLSEKDRLAIRSGSVFVFIEKESKIKRWTDGKIWSPSRICGEFLLYRELEHKPLPPKRGLSSDTIQEPPPCLKLPSNLVINSNKMNDDDFHSISILGIERGEMGKVMNGRGGGLAKDPSSETITTNINSSQNNNSKSSINVEFEDLEDIEKEVMKSIISSSTSKMSIGGGSSSLSLGTMVNPTSSTLSSSPSKSLVFKQDGLVKKTISLNIAEETFHLICYFKESQVNHELLALSPNRLSAFENLKIYSKPSPFIIHENHHSQISNTANIAYQLLRPNNAIVNAASMHSPFGTIPIATNIGGMGHENNIPNIDSHQKIRQEASFHRDHQNLFHHSTATTFTSSLINDINDETLQQKKKRKHRLAPATPILITHQSSTPVIATIAIGGGNNTIAANIAHMASFSKPSSSHISSSIEQRTEKERSYVSEEQLLFSHFIESMKPLSSSTGRME